MAQHCKKRIENDRIAKRAYVGECTSSYSVGRLQKRWIDTVKNSLRKKGLDVRQARRMVQDKSEWRMFLMPQLWVVTAI